MKSTPYQITVRGPLSATLISAFDGLTARSSAAGTVLSGEIAGQAAFFGLLAPMESTGLELVDIRPVLSAG